MSCISGGGFNPDIRRNTVICLVGITVDFKVELNADRIGVELQTYANEIPRYGSSYGTSAFKIRGTTWITRIGQKDKQFRVVVDSNLEIGQVIGCIIVIFRENDLVPSGRCVQTYPGTHSPANRHVELGIEGHDGIQAARKVVSSLVGWFSIRRCECEAVLGP